jgi:hypothetical protein
MSSVADLWSEFSARRFLDRLARHVGIAGLAAAAVSPALLAAIDQHAAAVRDIVTIGVTGSAAVAGVVLLAGYTRGLLDQAEEQGWALHVPTSVREWLQADWLAMRLVAVCALSMATGRLGDNPLAVEPPEPANEAG